VRVKENRTRVKGTKKRVKTVGGREVRVKESRRRVKGSGSEVK